MPHKEESKLNIVELHPTFAAEVYDVDFSQGVSDDDFDEIYKAITKVSRSNRYDDLLQALSELYCSMVY